MKYRNAKDVLPDELMREVQKYAAGEALYFPKASGRKSWGEHSGARAYYRERNDEIRQKFRQKRSIDSIAGEYGLSADTVRKIVYSGA